MEPVVRRRLVGSELVEIVGAPVVLQSGEDVVEG